MYVYIYVDYWVIIYYNEYDPHYFSHLLPKSDKGSVLLRNSRL